MKLVTGNSNPALAKAVSDYLELPLTDALVLIASFYGFIEALSRRRGFDPDHPPHLNKVTETL